MESCLAVEKELDKVLNKFHELDNTSQKQIADLISRIQTICANIDSDSSESVTAASTVKIMELIAEARSVTSKMSSNHRELHSTVSKVGKAIDKNFMHDYTVAAIDPKFLECERRSRLVSDLVCRHFQRTGQPDAGGQLLECAQLVATEPVVEPYIVINSVVEALRRHDLQPALSWTEQRSEQLRSQGSLLEFRLRRLRYLTLLQEGRTVEAIHEARGHLSRFCAAFDQQLERQPDDQCLLAELRRLMGALAYAHVGLQRSPYAHMAGRREWLEICDVFTRDACRLLGLSVDSPLQVVVNAGCKVVPLLMNMKQVMQQRQVGGMWSSKDDLPIEVDVDREFRYHSVFACPILKQQATELNPPVKLICGHCISKDALQKLSHGNKLKCPYCPVEMNAADARLVYF